MGTTPAPTERAYQIAEEEFRGDLERYAAFLENAPTERKYCEFFGGVVNIKELQLIANSPQTRHLARSEAQIEITKRYMLDCMLEIRQRAIDLMWGTP